MEIKGFIDVSLVDWNGKISSVIFLPSCNMRCPYCYNAPLVLHPDKLPTIPLEVIEKYLKKNRGWIDGVVITGGEPTIHRDLPNLCKKIKELGFPIKLDTNGTNPKMIKKLINMGLIDSVAMDVKAPLTEEKYSEVSGVNAKSLIEKIEETIETLLRFNIEHEFRTTVVPGLHRKEDIEEICPKIKSCRKYAIQNYRPQGETVNPKFKGLKPFSVRRMEAFIKTAKKIIPNTIMRS